MHPEAVPLPVSVSVTRQSKPLSNPKKISENQPTRARVEQNIPTSPYFFIPQKKKKKPVCILRYKYAETTRQGKNPWTRKCTDGCITARLSSAHKPPATRGTAYCIHTLQEPSPKTAPARSKKSHWHGIGRGWKAGIGEFTATDLSCDGSGFVWLSLLSPHTPLPQIYLLDHRISATSEPA